MKWFSLSTSGQVRTSRENKEPEGDGEAQHVYTIMYGNYPHCLQERGWSSKWGVEGDGMGVKSARPSETVHGCAPQPEAKHPLGQAGVQLHLETREVGRAEPCHVCR